MVGSVSKGTTSFTSSSSCATVYPPFAKAIFGVLDEETIDAEAGRWVPYSPNAEDEDVVVHRMRVTGRPWREIIRWRRMVQQIWKLDH